MNNEDLKCCGNCKYFEQCFLSIGQLRCRLGDHECLYNDICNLWEFDNMKSEERTSHE